MQCKKGFTVIEVLSYIIIVQILIVIISKLLIYIPHKTNEIFTRQINTTNAALFLTSFSEIIEDNDVIDFERIANGITLFINNYEIKFINNKYIFINDQEKSIYVINYDISDNLIHLSINIGDKCENLVLKGNFNEIYPNKY